MAENSEHEEKKQDDRPCESKLRLRAMADAAYEAIFLSEKGICIDQNPTAEKLFGYTLQEARGRHGSEWIAPEDRELVRKHMQLDEIGPYTVTALRKDGTSFPCEIRSRNLYYPDRIVRVTALRDISEFRRAEQEKENLQAKLAQSIEMAHLGPWEYDAVHDLFSFNDHFYKIFRTTAAQVGGYSMTSAEYARRFVHPDDAALVGEEVRKALIATDPQYSSQLEHRILYADGTVGHISVHFFIHKDSAGRTIRTYGVNQDITARKQSEDALKQLNAQLKERTDLAEARARQLQTLAMELIESEERERRRISELLHDDLQQLLSAALIQLDVTRDAGSAHELDFVRRLLGESISVTRSLAHELSPAVLYHSGLVAGLNWLARQMDEKFGLNVRLDVHLERRLDFSPDQVFIYRAVQELLFNAVKHSTVKRARVALALVGEVLRITVSDQGCGFDANALESGRKEAGLGLIRLRERSNFLGGRLEIESAPGKGSRLR